MEPQHPGRVAHHHLGRLLRVVPVPGLQLVPGHAQLAPVTDGHGAAVGVDNLGARVRHQRAHRRQPRIHGIVGKGVEACRRRLRQPVAARKFDHPEALHQHLHQIPRHRGPGDDACTQPLAAEARWRLGLKQRVKHGGHAVHRRASLVRDGPQRGRNVEDLGGEDNLGPVRHDGQEAQDQPEAVEKRRRAAQDVVGRQAYPIANEA